MHTRHKQTFTHVPSHVLSTMITGSTEFFFYSRSSEGHINTESFFLNKKVHSFLLYFYDIYDLGVKTNKQTNMLLILVLCVMLRIKELPQFFYVIHTINNLFPRKRCFSVCSRSGQLASLLPHCRTNADQFNPILQQETLSSDKFARL